MPSDPLDDLGNVTDDEWWSEDGDSSDGNDIDVEDVEDENASSVEDEDFESEEEDEEEDEEETESDTEDDNDEVEEDAPYNPPNPEKTHVSYPLPFLPRPITRYMMVIFLKTAFDLNPDNKDAMTSFNEAVDFEIDRPEETAEGARDSHEKLLELKMVANIIDDEGKTDLMRRHLEGTDLADLYQNYYGLEGAEAIHS